MHKLVPWSIFLVMCRTAAHGAPVGNTSYATLPFQSRVFQTCWSCSQGLEPANLFFSANPRSRFLDPAVMSQSRAAVTGLVAHGLVPAGGAQRWEGTYEASFPAGTFRGEPTWVADERKTFNLPSQPEFVAWRDFITKHPQYWDVAFDGGTMPNQKGSFRDWGSQWGFISPLTPLDPVDCPPDMRHGCNWGDEYAYRWAKTSSIDKSFAIVLSDFSDSQPEYEDNLHDFNPRIVAAFATKFGYIAQLAGLKPGAAARWIDTNPTAYPQWSDFLSQGYGHFYGALATRIGAAAGRKALVIDQCSTTPAYRRLAGTDQRIILSEMNPDSYLCIWDNQSIQAGRGGPVLAPPAGALAGAIVGAAREPDARNGANLEADDPAYWKAIASFYPTLTETDRREAGIRILKRLWLWEAWAHIATRDGSVRRALALVSRDYWDAGSLALLDPLTSLMQTIRPTAPFGPALYYSVAVERAVESHATTNPPGASFDPYLQWQPLAQFIDGGGGFGYYVSDVGLPKIRAAAANAPSAWILLDTGNLLPKAELQQLQAIAPVVTSVAALSALPHQPFKVSAGLTGFAFLDQKDRLTMVISNPSTLPDAHAVVGKVTLSGLPAAGRYKVTDLFTNATNTVKDEGGTISIPVSLLRWDSQALRVTPAR